LQALSSTLYRQFSQAMPCQQYSLFMLNFGEYFLPETLDEALLHLEYGF
jgi:hypothetical protein